jgi:ADP-ribose diphosphatase
METLFDDFGWKITMESATLPDGRLKKGVRVHRSDSAHIIAFKTPKTILVLREYRAFHGEYLWMLPSGKVDKETDIPSAAHRELREEAGYDAHEMTKLFTANLSDSIDITNHVFLAKDLFESPLEQDADELIEVHELSVDDALKNILGSPKVHLASAYALLRYLHEQNMSS